MGRVLSPALWQHAVRKEEQKVVPLSLAEERGGGGGATQPHQQSAEELQLLLQTCGTDHNRVSV
jgi:hypothetical protein